MDTLYLVCAALGGTILVVQTALMFIGLGGDAGDVADVGDFDGADVAFKVLSFKTVVAFLAFFGIGGLAAQGRGWDPTQVLLVALGAGAVAMILVAYLMTALLKLQSQGNVDLGKAVGVQGKVYLRIPAENQGLGKVILEVQGRRLECKAVTRGAELPTGAQVTVVATPAQDTVEVQAL